MLAGEPSVTDVADEALFHFGLAREAETNVVQLLLLLSRCSGAACCCALLQQQRQTPVSARKTSTFFFVTFRFFNILFLYDKFFYESCAADLVRTAILFSFSLSTFAAAMHNRHHLVFLQPRFLSTVPAVMHDLRYFVLRRRLNSSMAQFRTSD